MKKKISKILILIVMITVLGLIIIQIMPEVFLSNARVLENHYQWKKAQHFYEVARKINPLCDKYQIALGKLFMKQGRYRKNKDKWYGMAEKMFLRACKLNPSYAFNWYELGTVYLVKSMNVEKNADRDKLVLKTTGCFENASRLNPFNFRLNYSIGCDLLQVWQYLKSSGKAFVIERFRGVINVDPEYFKKVYPIFMYYTNDFESIQKIAPDNLEAQENVYKFLENNNLWGFRASQEKIVNRYFRKENPKAYENEKNQDLKFLKNFLEQHKDSDIKKWFGKSEDGKHQMNNGQMYWSGTIRRTIDIPSGATDLTISVKGTKADGVSPYMIVKLDSAVIGEMFVENADWKRFDFDLLGSKIGKKVLSVIFVNDGRSLDGGEDRNLFVGEVSIN